jgi:translation initiation factor 1
MSKNSRLVYSTETGRIKPDDKPTAAAPAGDGVVRLHRETKGRKGKGVTIITGLALDEQELKVLAKKLKQLCGTGGSVKDGHIEIQGEQREKLKAFLESQGHKVKIAGG